MVNPDDAGLLEALGLLYYMQKNYDLAVMATRRAWELKGSEVHLLSRLGSFYLNSGHGMPAINCFSSVLEMQPNHIRARINLAKAYFNNLDYYSAAENYLLALRENPEADHVWNLLFSAFNGMNRPDLIEKLGATRDPMMFADEFECLS
jgi:Flp pilus assembly protein TadD